MTTQKHFYITTTIPYVNAAPHIGFALEIVQADALARYKRLMGYDVFFNFGSDEHGQKIWQNATEEGITPQAYTDKFALQFEGLKERLNLTYTAFTRTTNPHHKSAAQAMWRLCTDAGYIYKKNYSIKYCVGCELEKSDSELDNGVCPFHTNRILEVRDEENYFFKLSALQDGLIELYKREDYVVPNFRLNEIRSLIEEKGLQDFSISRLKAKMPWGVAVPDDDDHVMYVWFDALVNYISTLGWPENTEQFNTYWNGTKECVQVAGKDQVRQQACMWPAILIAAGLPVTGQIFIHGFIHSGGAKMSKSLGNVIDPYTVVSEYGTDALRYFLLRHIHPTEDSDFTMGVFHEAYTAGLVNGIGNLTARIMKLATTHLAADFERPESVPFPAEYSAAFESFRFNDAAEYVWGRVQALDQKISIDEPYKVVKVDLEAGKRMIAEARTELYVIARLLQPLMPLTSDSIKDAVMTHTNPQHLFARK